MAYIDMNKPKPTNQIVEMILGITGSIFGIIGGLIALILTMIEGMVLN